MITTQDGTRIYYKDWGTGQPVVFSHGWPLNADAWQSQMVFLAQNGYRTIATTAAATALEPAFWWQRYGHLRWNDVVERLQADGVQEVTAAANPLRGVPADSAYIARACSTRPPPAQWLPLAIPTEAP